MKYNYQVLNFSFQFQSQPVLNQNQRKNFLPVSHYIISLTDFFLYFRGKNSRQISISLVFFKHFTKFYCTAFVTSPINFILKPKILTKVFSRSSHVIMSMILTFNTQNLFCSHHYKEASMSWYLDCEFINYIRLQTHKNPLHTVFLDHISGIEIVINTVLSYGSTIYHYCIDK